MTQSFSKMQVENFFQTGSNQNDSKLQIMDDQLDLKEWVKKQPITLEGMPKPIIRMSLQQSQKRKFTRRHKSLQSNVQQDQGMQTDFSSEDEYDQNAKPLYTDGEFRGSNDPLPNIKFTKRKMKVEKYNNKTSKKVYYIPIISQSGVQLHETSSPGTNRSKTYELN